MTSPSVDLTEIEAAVEHLEIGANAFELHGGVCGLLCAQGPGAVDRWLHESGVTVRADLEDRLLWLETLHAAEADVWRALNAASFDFDLVLPAEEAEIGDRVGALAAWCHGFVTGIGLGGLADRESDENGPSQLEEILADLAEISRVALTDEDAGNVDRAGFDLAAVSEHVRVCVQLAFELLQAPGEAELDFTDPLSMH